MNGAWRGLALAAFALVALAACSDGDDDGGAEGIGSEVTPTASADGPSPVITERSLVCDPLEVIAAYEREVAEALATGRPYGELRALIIDSAPAVTVAYADVATIVPSVAADARVMTELLEATAEAAPGATSMPDLVSKLVSLPQMADEPEAREAIAELALDRCQIVLTTS